MSERFHKVSGDVRSIAIRRGERHRRAMQNWRDVFGGLDGAGKRKLRKVLLEFKSPETSPVSPTVPEDQELFISGLKKKYMPGDKYTRLNNVYDSLAQHGINSSVLLLPSDTSRRTASSIYRYLDLSKVPYGTIEDIARLDLKEMRDRASHSWSNTRNTLGEKNTQILKGMILNAHRIIEERS